jgi:hypothetical protein
LYRYIVVVSMLLMGFYQTEMGYKVGLVCTRYESSRPAACESAWLPGFTTLESLEPVNPRTYKVVSWFFSFSKECFQMGHNLYRYTPVLRSAGPYVLPFLLLPPMFVGVAYVVGPLYNLNPVVTHSSKAPGFNP